MFSRKRLQALTSGDDSAKRISQNRHHVMLLPRTCPTPAPRRAFLALAACPLADTPLDEEDEACVAPQAATVRAAVSIASVAACISADSSVVSDGLGSSGVRTNAAPSARRPIRCHGYLRTALTSTRYAPSPTMPMNSTADENRRFAPSCRRAHPSTELNSNPPLSSALLSLGIICRRRAPSFTTTKNACRKAGVEPHFVRRRTYRGHACCILDMLSMTATCTSCRWEGLLIFARGEDDAQAASEEDAHRAACLHAALDRRLDRRLRSCRRLSANWG